jgi:hypothetical protein
LLALLAVDQTPSSGALIPNARKASQGTRSSFRTSPQAKAITALSMSLAQRSIKQPVRAIRFIRNILRSMPRDLPAVIWSDWTAGSLGVRAACCHVPSEGGTHEESFSSVQRCSSQRCLSRLMVSRPRSQRPMPSSAGRSHLARLLAFIAAPCAEPTGLAGAVASVTRWHALPQSAQLPQPPVGAAAGVGAEAGVGVAATAVSMGTPAAPVLR